MLIPGFPNGPFYCYKNNQKGKVLSCFDMLFIKYQKVRLKTIVKYSSTYREFCEIFKNTLFIENARTIASENTVQKYVTEVFIYRNILQLLKIVSWKETSGNVVQQFCWSATIMVKYLYMVKRLKNTCDRVYC